MSFSLSLLVDTSVDIRELLDTFLEPVKQDVRHVKYLEIEKEVEATFLGTTVLWMPMRYQRIECNKQWPINGYVPLDDEVRDEQTVLITRLVIDFIRRTNWDIALLEDDETIMMTRIGENITLHNTSGLVGKHYWWERLQLKDDLINLEYVIKEGK